MKGSYRPKPLPVVHAMLICDKIITEDKNKKKTLLGIFDRINCSQLPVKWPELSVYINLSDVASQYDIRIELVHLEDGRVRSEVKGMLQPKTKLNWELEFRFRNLQFDKEGIYAFRFWAGEDILQEKYLHVRCQK